MGLEADVVLLLLDVDGGRWSFEPRNIYVAASRAQLQPHLFVKDLSVLRLLEPFGVEEVLRAATRALGNEKVIQRGKGNRDRFVRRGHPAIPRGRELEARDAGQDVDSIRLNSHLDDDAR